MLVCPLLRLGKAFPTNYDIWWWYESDWSGYTYDGSVDHISQGYGDPWQWDPWSGWDQTWEYAENEVSKGEQTETKTVTEVSKQESKPVGSLVLSPLFGAAQEDVEFCGPRVGSFVSLQPFCAPQPFEEGSEGPQNREVERQESEVLVKASLSPDGG